MALTIDTEASAGGDTVSFTVSSASDTGLSQTDGIINTRTPILDVSGFSPSLGRITIDIIDPLGSTTNPLIGGLTDAVHDNLATDITSVTLPSLSTDGDYTVRITGRIYKILLVIQVVQKQE